MKTIIRISPLLLAVFLAAPAALRAQTNEATATTDSVEKPSVTEGRALARELCVQRPDKDFQADGKLKLRSGDGQRGEVALHFATTVVSDSNWTTLYEVTGVTNGARLTVTHHGAAPNTYAFSEAGKESTPAGAGVMVPFAGSDFWLADLGLEFLHWPQQTVLRKDHRLSRACRVLESVNPAPAAGSYARVNSWVDRESGGILFAEAYDADGKLLKQFAPKEIKKVNGQWQLQEMQIENVQTGSRTTIVFQLKN